MTELGIAKEVPLVRPPEWRTWIRSSRLRGWVRPVGRSASRGLLALGWLVAALALFILFWSLAMLPAVWFMPLASHPDQDMSHFRYWIAWLTEQGVERGYAGIFPASYIIYPPLSLYLFHFVGQVMIDVPAPPDWLLPYWPAEGVWPNALVRLPVVVFHGLMAAVVYWSTVQWKGVRWAIPAMLAYALNPAVIFDLVYWSQPDSYHSLFAVVALLALRGRWPEVGWLAMSVAALAKPQAWIYLPVLVIVTWRRHGFGTVLSGAVFFLVGAIPIVWPFVVSERFWELVSVFVNFSRVMPVVSANAHNLWWAIMGQDALFKADSAIWVGPFTYQSVGLALLLGGYFIGLLKIVGDDDRKTLFSSAGLMSFVFFLFATQIHENHAFLVFPMLAMCWVADWRLGLVYLIVSATMFANMALHDPILEPLAAAWLLENLPNWLPESVRTFLSPVNLMTLSVGLNFYALAIWLASFLWGGPRPVSVVERRRRAAWGGAIGGMATAGAIVLAVAFTLLPPPAGEETGPLASLISTKPVEEPNIRIVTGGGGSSDPVFRRTQTVYLAAGGAATVALVTIAFVGHQGAALYRRPAES